MTAMIALAFGASLVAMTPRPVEISMAGQTGEAQKLSDGIRSAFQQSPHFILGTDHRLGTLYVYIPVKVGTRLVGKRVEYSTELELSQAAPNSPERLSSVVNVTCWEDDIVACGRSVLAKAERFP